MLSGTTEHPLTLQNCGVEVTFEQVTQKVVALGLEGRGAALCGAVFVVLGLLGPDGPGKSSLLRLLAGVRLGGRARGRWIRTA